VLLVTQRDRLPWDRRIGLAGLSISVVAFAVLGLWLLMKFFGTPAERPQFNEFQLPAQRSWTVVATQVGVLVVSIMLHECAHAMAAYWSGDGTAARLGRISLNPLRHVDPFGTIILPAILLLAPGGFMLGWAKPVPINPRQFRRPRHGLLAVTLAGVSVNLMLALASTAGLLAVGSALRLAYPDATSEGFAIIVADCRIHGAAAGPAWELAITALKAGIIVNMILFTFNVLPIPPLDGFGVLESLAPASFAPLIVSLRSTGWILLIVLIATGILGYVLVPGLLAAILMNGAVAWETGWS
jgi:Zn-dependent protease